MPKLPYEMSQKDLEHLLTEMRIEYDSVRLIKKAEDKVFAFI